jgi:putative membrane protein
MTTSDLPALNAVLNSISAILLAIGYRFIRQRNRNAHRKCMLGAFATSTLFLISYLTYHYLHGSTKFQGQGIARVIYLTILLTHTVLAAAIVPLVFITLSRALSARFDKHRRIARWTLPIWLYVSVTGVIVYLMLYQLYPHNPMH